MDKLLTIKNEFLKADISLSGAEVHYFGKLNDNYNYVWSGDQEYWKGRNPILFPQVSSTDNKTTLINDVYYHMGNHGFARNCTFQLCEHNEDELTLELVENEDTLKQYPFNFILRVNYKLITNRLVISYSLFNNNDVNMPYGFGLHPAFSCLDEYVDTNIELEKEEEIFGKIINVSKQLFLDYPTVIIDNVKSTYAILKSGDREIKIGFDGFKMLGIWSCGPFVCVEPWMNLTDKNHAIEMAKRKGFSELKPNEKFFISYFWEVK